MKDSRHWMARLAEASDLVGENPPGQPIVEVTGDRRVLIENHRGVTAYGREEICIRVSFGSIKVCGSCLELARMTKDQLVILGQISSVTFCGRG